jgi:SAM-dependent methyltransferase
VQEFRGYPVLVRRVTVRGRAFELVGPANYEALVDDPRVIQRFEQDEFLPYWAEFWPACALLADLVAAWPVAERSLAPCVLEIGCGLGLASLVAASRGYRAIASDYDADALAFVSESARRSAVGGLETRWIDWRKTYPELRADRIIAAEVLYEPRNLEPVARFVHAHLTPGGQGFLVDGNRQTADVFPGLAESHGLVVETQPVSLPSREIVFGGPGAPGLSGGAPMKGPLNRQKGGAHAVSGRVFIVRRRT